MDKKNKYKVSVFCEAEQFCSYVNRTAQAARAALFFEKARVGTAVSIFLITDSSMRKLNKETRNKDNVTNILSFESPDRFPHPETKRGIFEIGQIYLAPRFIEKKEEDVAFLTIHGTLHLLGYVHRRKNDRMIMEKEEEKIFSLNFE